MGELVPTEKRVSPALSEKHDVLCCSRVIPVNLRGDGWAPSEKLKLGGPSKEGEDPKFLH
jgi:hypothetical protein